MQNAVVRNKRRGLVEVGLRDVEKLEPCRGQAARKNSNRAASHLAGADQGNRHRHEVKLTIVHVNY